LQAPLPLQDTAAPEHVTAEFVSSAPAGLFVQVPRLPVTLQAWHVARQRVPQQTPSTQKVLWHCEPLVHVPPLAFKQTPLPSQMAGAAHRGLSEFPDMTFEQVPTLPDKLHDLHAVEQEVAQQTPSAQTPLAHSLLDAQVCATTFLQFPAPSHARVPLHVPSVEYFATLVHVPMLPVTLQDWQFAVHAELQQ
jgi:hypothetical protein